MLETFIKKKICVSKAFQEGTGDVKIKRHKAVLRTGDQ